MRAPAARKTLGESDVVVEQTARWADPSIGAVPGKAIVASHFRIENGIVSRLARNDDLPGALTAARLTQIDEVTRRR